MYSPTSIARTWTMITLAIVLGAAPALARPSDYVNTLRGTNSHPGYSRGNTFPAVTMPFGFNFWTPITEGNSSQWLYAYNATTISGFGLSHEPSPWIGDHGTIQIMPMVGTLRAAPDARKAGFSHSNEIARAHYYSVLLASGIKVEMTPTDHASAWRFTFPSASSAFLLFDSIDSVGGSINVDAASRVISGYTDHSGPRMYFYARVNKAIATQGKPTGAGVSAYVGFATSNQEVVTMTMATSFLDVAQAQRNLDQEIGNRSFDDIREAAATAWDAALGRIAIEGATADQQTTFYSCLYRAFMYPNSMWENVNGTARYASPYDGQVHDGKIWVNNGFWDTFRAAWPLYTLLMPTRTGEMLDGFVRAFKDGGWTPRWSGPGYIDIMVGSHADILFADAYQKGVRNFDQTAAYESMLRNAMVYSSNGSVGRKGNQVSIFRGYIPTDVLPESAAWYLEDRINDHGLSLMASALGRTDEATYFRQRSLNYVNLFSRSVGFFRGRQSNGAWRTSDAAFRANEWGYEFTEGAPWHYATAAHHDPQGMANLYGGRANLSAKIDAVFAAPRDYLVGSYGGVIHEMLEAYDTDMGQYAHANEPIHHMIYMYNYAGTPWKAQRRVREVLGRLYDSGTGTGNGYLGDEDNGQMSAWYAFSALGLYPAAPGSPEYAIGSPLFTRATVNLENGRQFVVEAINNNSTNVYVQSARLNGAAYTRNYVTHADLVAGGRLELTMGPQPSTWGGGAGDVPPSTTTGSRSPVPMVDVATAGTITASNENAGAGEGRDKAFDDSSLTKWLAWAPTASIQYQFTGRRHAVTLYTLTSANDVPGRDPRSWRLRGSNDGTSWVTLDTRSGQDFTWRHHTRVFSVANAAPYAHYQLEITANHGEPLTQLAEIELLGRTPVAATAATSPTTACAPSEQAAFAIDGSLESKWCALVGERRLQIDLGRAHDVDQLVVRHAASGGESAEWNSKDFTLAVSSDGVAWTEVARVTGNRDSVTQHTFPTTIGRYVRLDVSTPTQNGDPAARIYEVEVFGAPRSAVSASRVTAITGDPSSDDFDPGDAGTSTADAGTESDHTASCASSGGHADDRGMLAVAALLIAAVVLRRSARPARG